MRPPPRLTLVGAEIPSEPPVAGDETATLLGELERVRAVVAWKSGGLDAAGMRATLPPSELTLGGLVKHLALIEDDYFGRRLWGRPHGPPWDSVDWEAEPNWEFRTGAEEPPEDVRALWEAAVDRSRASVAEALSVGGLDQQARDASFGNDAPSLRRILVDMIEEYARHAGHADLIRESVDGLTGEGPPR